MVEKQLNLDFTPVYSKLTALANPSERVTSEHIKLYQCYVNQVTEAVTQVDLSTARMHLGKVQEWFNDRHAATSFRN